MAELLGITNQPYMLEELYLRQATTLTGFDKPLSYTDGLWKKQHARLGTALHRLSQELYSKDSHIIL